jgi:hypothetical protein
MDRRVRIDADACPPPSIPPVLTLAESTMARSAVEKLVGTGYRNSMPLAQPFLTNASALYWLNSC